MRRGLPGLGISGPDEIGPRRDERLGDGAAGRVLASVTRTLRDFGSEFVSRIKGSSSICGVSFSGRAISMACPLLSSASRNARRRRSAIAMQGGNDVRPAIEPHEPHRPRRALAEIEFLAVVDRGLRDTALLARPRRASGASRRGIFRKPRAAGIARHRSPRSAARRSRRRGHGGQALGGAASRGRRKASAAGCARSGFLRFGGPRSFRFLGAALVRISCSSFGSEGRRIAAPEHTPRS